MATEWYYQSGGKEYGPFTGSQLKQHADAGRVGPETLVKRDNDDRWLPAAQVQGLLAAAPSAEPMAAPPMKRVPVARPAPPRAKAVQAASQPETLVAEVIPDADAASVEPAVPNLYEVPRAFGGRSSRSYSRSKKQPSSKWIVNIGFGVLTAVLGLFGLAASWGLFGNEQRAIEAEAARINKTLPQQIDEITRWDRMEAGQGKMIINTYTVSQELSPEQKRAMQATVTEQLRAQPLSKRVFQAGVKFRLRYRNPAGKTILEFTVSG